MNINSLIKSTGRFQLRKHTGHTFDDAGNVLKFGKILEQTPLINNFFTDEGRAFLISTGSNQVSMNLSTDGTPPSESGIGAILRTSTTLVSAFTSRSLVPDADGNVWWRKTYIFNFPIDGGFGVETIRQLIASVTGGPLTGGVTNGAVSASLILGPLDVPTEVVVDMATESLDVVWEYTEYFPPEVIGTITATVIDGSGNILSTTNHSYILRPANLNNVSDSNKGWGELLLRTFPSFSASTTTIKLGLGSIGFAGAEPTFTEVLVPSSVDVPLPTVGVSPYVVGVHLLFDDTTSTGLIDCAQFMLGHTEWQVSISPPVVKQSKHLATFNFNLITG